jgi:hypothetical protein
LPGDPDPGRIGRISTVAATHETATIRGNSSATAFNAEVALGFFTRGTDNQPLRVFLFFSDC